MRKTRPSLTIASFGAMESGVPLSPLIHRHTLEVSEYQRHQNSGIGGFGIIPNQSPKTGESDAIIVVEVEHFIIETASPYIYSRLSVYAQPNNNNIRTRISFEILRSVLVAVRGVRGKIRQMKVDPISTLAFNLIPQQSQKSYEMP